MLHRSDRRLRVALNRVQRLIGVIGLKNRNSFRISVMPRSESVPELPELLSPELRPRTPRTPVPELRPRTPPASPQLKLGASFFFWREMRIYGAPPGEGKLVV